MKLLHSVFLLVSFITLPLCAQTPQRVLFLGNSYTYVNNLPTLIANMAHANKDTLYYDANLIGGFTFNNHFNDPTSKAKIALGNWDYVVLQAQSQEPSFSPAQVNAQTLPYALKLDSLVQVADPCAVPVFYETWGRKNGDASNCAFYPPVCTYAGMQNRLRDSYKFFTDTTKGIMAPVGEAFRSSIAQSPTLNLYSSDESHPSLEGSYLAAAVFYEVLFKKSVVSNTYNPGLSGNTTLSFLQQVAHALVTDSLSTWRIGIHTPYSAFTTASVTTASWQFTPTFSTMQHVWRFGDGITSTLTVPSHTYAVSGTYTVQHVMYSACQRDSSNQVVQAIVKNDVSVREQSGNWFELSPNPLTVMCTVVTPFNGQLRISDATGRIVKRVEVHAGSTVMDVSDLRAGVYLFELPGASPRRVIKQD
jgi:hypothetical protein